MAETFTINLLMTKLRSTTRLGRLQQDTEMTIQQDDYHYQLIAVVISKQKELDADSRAIQQNEFYGMLETHSQKCIVLKKFKRNDPTISQKEQQKFYE